jgi:hypothetical protein
MKRCGGSRAVVVVGLILPLVLTSLLLLQPEPMPATAVVPVAIVAEEEPPPPPLTTKTSPTEEDNTSSNEDNVSIIRTTEGTNTDCETIRREVFDLYEYKKEQECAIQCIQFYSNGTYSVQSLFPEQEVQSIMFPDQEQDGNCLMYYVGEGLHRFLRDVTTTMTNVTTTDNETETTTTTTTTTLKKPILVGTAVAKTADLVEFSHALIQQLHDRHIPVLAHAIAKEFVDNGVILIPDWHFIEHSAWSALTATMRNQGKSLRDRSATIYWRGTTTGVNCNADYATIDLHNPSILRDPCQECASLQRVAAVQIAQTSPYLDLALTSAVQYCRPSHLQELFPSLVVGVGDGLMHNELDWIAARGVLDIDGNSNAWGARWRLESGSVLFKVESYITNAYLSRMVPYVHYIPIFANLSNLASQAQLVGDELVVPSLEVIVENANQLMAEFTYERKCCAYGKSSLRYGTKTNGEPAKEGGGKNRRRPFFHLGNDERHYYLLLSKTAP